MNRLYMEMNEIIFRHDESKLTYFPHSKKIFLGLGPNLGSDYLGAKRGEWFGVKGSRVKIAWAGYWVKWPRTNLERFLSIVIIF